MQRNDNRGYKTLKDFAKIISLFNTFQTEERSVSEISKLLGMQPSKVSRLIRTLENEGFFEKNSETRKYRLGIEFFKLGIIYAHHSPLRKIVRPHIEQMARELNLTASCGVLNNDNVIVIDRVQNLNMDLMSFRISSLPVHATAIGKVILAYLPEKEQDRILHSIELKKFTPTTIVDVKLIKENLQLIRKSGYAIDEGETHEDLISIAAPIRNSHEGVVAAINLLSEKSRIPKEKLFQFADYLKEKALFISRQLGYTINI